MIVYGRKIDMLSAYRNLNGNANYVYGLNWILFGEEDGISAHQTMYTEVPAVEGNFIPYEELTEATLLDWVDKYTPAENIKRGEAYVEGLIKERQLKTMLYPYWVIQEQQAMLQKLKEQEAAAAIAE